MPNTFEETGKTVDDAIDAALAKLNCAREDIEIEILDEGSPGLLDLVPARPARIRVSATSAPVKKKGEDIHPSLAPRREVSDDDTAVATAREFLATTLELMGYEDVFLHVEREGEYIYADIATQSNDDAGLVIGREGDNINALQHVVSKVVNRDPTEKLYVVVDTEDYRRRRTENLERDADVLRSKVKRNGRPALSAMLNPHDRRIIHLALAEDPEVETNSIGEGFYKQVKVSVTDEWQPRDGGPPTVDGGSGGSDGGGDGDQPRRPQRRRRRR